MENLSYLVKNNVGHEASGLIDIFRKFVMLCQFKPSYNRKLVGIKDVLASEEVRLDNSKKSIKGKQENLKEQKHLTIELGLLTKSYY